MTRRSPAGKLVLLAAALGVLATLGVLASGSSSAEETLATDPDRSVSSGPDQVRIPDLRGLSVAKAEARLRRLGLRPERGAILTRQGKTEVLSRGSRDERIVRSHQPGPNTFAIQGTPVTLGTEGGQGLMRVRELVEVTWRRTAYRRGLLTLSGLGAGGIAPVGGVGCGVVDHASIEGAGRQRILRVWVANFRPNPRVRTQRCAPPRRAQLRPGSNWNKRTIAWPTRLTPVRPGLPDATRVPFQQAVLQPDRRHLVVSYWHGACDALTGSRVKLRGRRARVSLRIGRTGPPERACPAIALSDASVIRLPRRLPANTRFIPSRR